METSMMFGLMDLIVFVCCLYIIYAYYLLVAKNEIKQGILVSQKTDVRKCKDLEGYKKYIGIRLLAFGLAAVLSGAVSPVSGLCGSRSCSFVLCVNGAVFCGDDLVFDGSEEGGENLLVGKDKTAYFHSTFFRWMFCNVSYTVTHPDFILQEEKHFSVTL